jgi:hypothetical protein
MLRELCRRNGAYLPSTQGGSLQHLLSRSTSRASLVRTYSKDAMVVMVLCNPATIGDMLSDLEIGFDQVAPGRVQLQLLRSSDLSESVTPSQGSENRKVLLLLSGGVLEQPEVITQLENMLQADVVAHRDSLSVIYDEHSWFFGCPAQVRAAN